MRNETPVEADQAVLLKILQSIASEQTALGALAAAEVKKLTGLIRQIEQHGLHSFGRQRQELEKSCAAMLQTAVNMHIVLQSKAQALAAHLGIPYSPLLQTEGQGGHQLVSCGQGTVGEQQDSFLNGTAFLRSVRIVTRNEAMIAGDIHYSVSKQAIRQTLTALPGTLRVDWPGVNYYPVSPENPTTVTIRGRATIKKLLKQRKVRSDNAAFALTIQDWGCASCHHQFRMVITADKHLSLHHDSGIVDFTGIVQHQLISP